MDPFAKGELLDGKYELLGLLGKGGMGHVYEARHREVLRVVAVKVLRGELASDPTWVERFRREAVAAGKLDHDNICEVFDFGVHEGAPFYVMPLLRGISLTEAIRASGPMPVPRAVDVASQILAALAAAHAVGLVHRDLKPDNVFLTRVADRVDLVKVLDFGIAKLLRPEGEGKEATLTDTGAVLGTPCYLSPEQARGAKSVDGRADLYAVGVILYEMLTGRRAFDGTSHNEILWKIWNVPVPSLRSLRPELPEALQEVVHRAMSRDREERYGSADEMREALLEAARARSTADDPAVTQSTRPDLAAPPVVEAPAPPRGPEPIAAPGARRPPASSGRRWVVVSLVLAGAGALALGLVMGLRHEAPGVTSRGPAASATPEPSTSDAVPLVTLSLEGVPEGATVLLDGAPVDGTSLSARASRVSRELRVELAGHRPWRRDVDFAESRTIAVELEPLEPPEPRPEVGPDSGPTPRRRPPRRALPFDPAFPDP